MININKIIKKILNEQDELYTPAKLVTKPKGVFGNVLTFKDPVGNGFVVPENLLYGSPKLYNKQAWVDWYSDLTNARKQFNLILKNKDSTYKKLCYDQQLLYIISEFLKVRDTWIPDDLNSNKYGIDNLIIEDMIAIKNYFTKNKWTYRSKIANELNLKSSTKQIFDGTDYFFYLLQEWLKTTSIADKVELVKGNNKNHSKPIENEGISFGDNGDLKLTYAIRWDWFLNKSEFCDTTGHWATWYALQGSFVKALYENSVYSFPIRKEKFVAWSKMFNYKIDETKLEDPILFRACHKTLSAGVREFSGYYSEAVKPSAEGFSAGTVWNCSGIKFPGNGEILGLIQQRDIQQEEGWFSDAVYDKGSLIDIPLVFLNNNSLGKYYKQFVADNTSDMGTLQSAAYWFLKAVSNPNSESEENNESLFSLVDPSNYENKLEIPVETPFNMWSGNLFNEDDYIAHTKVAEDTTIYSIPQGGLSKYIPSAKVDKSGKYYVKFKSGENELVLYLPNSDWWNDYYDSVYKIKNEVKTSGYNNDTPIFGLVLSISNSNNLSSVIDTKGEYGWSFKLSNNGTMFYGVREGKINYNNEYYFPVNDFLTPYNFNDIEQFDSRSSFGQFMESWWGIAAQVVVAIVLAVVCAPLAAEYGILLMSESGLLAAESRGAASAVAKFLIQEGRFTTTRLEVYFAILFELEIIGVPMAMYYKSRGDDFGVALSILCCFLPMALSTKAFGTFTKKLWMSPVASSLSNEILLMGKTFFRQNMSMDSLMKFIGKLNSRQAMAFGELLRNLDTLGSEGVQQILTNAEKRIAILTKENAEKLSKILPKIRITIEQFAVNFAVVGGTMFVGIPVAKMLVDYWSAKGKKMTEAQKKNFESAFKNMMNYINKQFSSTVIERINQDLATSNKNLIIPDVDEWVQDFLEKNEDIFDKMCEENGWEKISSLESDPKNGYKKSLIELFNKNGKELAAYLSTELMKIAKDLGVTINGPSFDEKTVEDITVLGDDDNSYKFSKGLIYKKPKVGTDDWVEITNEEEKNKIKEKHFKDVLDLKSKESEFKPELDLIYSQYPCLSSTNNNFKFLGGEKDPFYVAFKVINGTYINKEIYLIYDYDTDQVDNDFKITTNDSSGYYIYFTDEIKKEYSC
jgi:hypothetical protein